MEGRVSSPAQAPRSSVEYGLLAFTRLVDWGSVTPWRALLARPDGGVRAYVVRADPKAFPS